MAAGGTGGEGAPGLGVRAARPERGRCVGLLWGLRALALSRGSSGRRPRSLGRAEPRPRRHLLAREAAAAPRPGLGHFPAEHSGAFLGGSSGGTWKRGRCLLSFPCFTKPVLVCGWFVSFRLCTNYWEAISE